MFYMTINTKKLKKIGIITIIAVIFGLCLCLWAISAVSQRNAAPQEQPESEQLSAPPALFTVLSASDISPTPSAADASVKEELEAALPAYVNLSPYMLGQAVHLPLESAFVSSSFGFRDHPINGKYSFHSGLDLAAPQGSDIHAMLDGTVTTAKFEASYGNYVIIDHADGLQTLYAHCLSLCVQPGQQVSKGDIIAHVGATGSATGPHLHVEFRQNGQRYDPTYILGDSYS